MSTPVSSDESDDENRLSIVMSQEITPRTSKSPKKKIKKRNSKTKDQLEELKPDETVEKMITTTAIKNNLTDDNIRKILRKVCLNDHVLALVKLGEEEWLRTEQKDEEIASEGNQIDGTNSETESIDTEPKLTRAKAKALNKQPLPLRSLHSTLEESEAALLVREEFHSDDEDDEYVPTNEDLNSDDDQNTTISDIDSMPCTPQTPYTPSVDDIGDKTPHYTDDGIFKIPTIKNTPTKQDTETEMEIIAARTRSKLCLTTTAIETIESEFVPPDITTDMYDFDTNVDNDWLNFLHGFTKPIDTQKEEDDETDPEYVACDQTPFDRDELLNVPVSKKELKDLVAQLFDEIQDLDLSPLPLSQISFENDSALQDDASAVLDEIVANHVNGTTSQDSFQPVEISTPVSTSRNVNLTKMVLCSDQSKISETIPLEPNQTQMNKRIDCFNSQFDSSRIDQSNYNNTISSGYHYNLSSITNSTISNKSSSINRSKIQNNSYCLGTSNASYTLPDRYNDCEPIITYTQLEILQQQLKIHIQQCTQNYLQLYPHPDLWKEAPRCKKNLEEINDNIHSYFNRTIIKPVVNKALNLTNEWELELASDCVENTEFIQDLCRINDWSKKRHDNRPIIHHRIMHKMLWSEVFTFPQLLPIFSFRETDIDRKIFIHSEDMLIALGLEHYSEELEFYLNKHKPLVYKTPSLKNICKYIANNLCQNRDQVSLYKHVSKIRNCGSLNNPIKYYFMHNKAPPLDHNYAGQKCDKNLAPIFQNQRNLPRHWVDYIRKVKGTPEFREKYNLYLSQELQPLLSPRSYYSNSANQKKPSFLRWTEPYQAISETGKQVTSDREVIIKIEGTTQFSFYGSEIGDQSNVDDSNSTISTHISSNQDDEKKQTLITDFFTTQIQQESVELTNDFKAKINKVNKSCKEDTHIVKTGRKSSALSRKLDIIRNLCYKRFRRFKTRFKKKILVIDIYEAIVEFLIYLDLKRDSFNKMASTCSKKVSGKIETTVEEIDNNTSLSDRENNGTTKSRSATKINRVENAISMLLPEKDGEILQRDITIAKNYLDSVEAVYGSEGNPEKYVEFTKILSNFDANNLPVSNLYNQLENFFLPDHPELLTLFLRFLLPEHAQELGKFEDHLVLQHMETFLVKANSYYNKHPSQLKKVFANLSELSEMKDLTMPVIKSRAIQLFRGSPLLADWFQQIFPSETVPENELNNGNYETVKLHNIGDEQEDEIFEYVSHKDILSEKEQSRRSSPKKRDGPKTVPNQTNLKHRSQSPSKRMNGIKSPNAIKSNILINEVVPSDSGAVRTARKFKALTDYEGESSVPLKKACRNPVRKVLEKQSNESIDGTKSSDEDNSSDNKIDRPWTRDEDKVMLEEIKNGFDVKELLASEKINRTEQEILERHQMLIELLSKLKKN